MQSKENLEDYYKTPDPWGFKTNPDDAIRRKIISALCQIYGQPSRVLDIGCGEGFILDEVLAISKEGIEISDNATSRLSEDIKRVTQPTGRYDIILCTGQLYEQYNYQTFTDWILDHAKGIVITSHYDQMTELNTLPEDKIIFTAKFKYREGFQNLHVYNFA